MERHLCERCAAAAGVQVQPQPPAVTQILSQLMQGATPGQTGAEKSPSQQGGSAAACIGCGLSFAQFRQAGMLGCPQCYSSFEGQLGTLLSRAHEGGTHHVGKVPRSIELARLASGSAGPAQGAAAGAAATATPQTDERARAALLRKQLADAVAAENYERAALLRDELQKLEALLRTATAPTGAPSLARPPRAARKPKPDEGEEGGGR